MKKMKVSSSKHDFSSQRRSSVWVARGFLFLWLLILGWRLFPPASTYHIWFNFLFLLSVFGYLLITAAGLGRIVLRLFRLPFSESEFGLLSLLMGIGLLSLSIAVLGMLGLLTKAGIFICLAIAGWFSSTEWNAILQSKIAMVRRVQLNRSRSMYEKLLLLLGIGLCPLLIANALAPVWDYDALLYHLEIPRQFLMEGRIYFDPDVFRSAYPFLGEMLFLVGIIFDLDSLAKLINLTYAILFVLSTYIVASRFFQREVALTAIGILISAPAFPLWSTWASIDYAWAVFELWSLYAVLLWLDSDKSNTRNWLSLTGVLSGFAASTKYISLPAMLIVAALIVWKSRAGPKRTWRAAVQNVFIFGLSAALVMSIWYLKNWIWTGNPVYPLVFGGPGWDSIKAEVLKGYMQTFGVGTSWLDYLILPYNVYAHQDQFSTSIQEIVHPLLWLAFLFPLLYRDKKYSVLIAYSGLYYLWWLFGSQVIRFLLPLSAVFAILAACVLEKWPPLIRMLSKLVLIIGVLIVSLVYQTLVLRNSGTFSYMAGRTSPNELLRLFVDDFAVKTYIQNSLESSARVLFLWDGRGYYCDSRCIPDDEQSQAVRLALNSPIPYNLAQELRMVGVTHLMLHRTDANWFTRYHDPNGVHHDALQYFEDKFLPACGKIIYSDSSTELYEITCP